MAERKKNMGKVFEKEFKDSVPADCFLERYKDDTSGFYGVSNPADFRLYKFPVLILLELKTHKGKSLPLAKIRPAQLSGMLKAVNYLGVCGGKKRTLYRYDLSSWLKRYELSVEVR